MSFTVTIRPSGHRYTMDADDTVLTAALREGFNLAYGCRNGACGSCKGRLLSGRIDYGHYQSSALSEAERAGGLALFCCARPLEDIEIECREVGAAKDIQIRKMPARVQKMVRAASDVMIVWLRLPQNERLQYLAGQYLDILLKDGRRRSFSMANPPHADELLELHIRDYGGVFSKHVFEQMKERDILRFEGPYGNFFLREESDKPIVLLASGTGFAPIKAMIEHALHIGLKRPLALYWGGRRRADLYLHDLAQRWAGEQPGLTYVPVLSEASPDDAWSARTGLVHRALMADHADLSGYQVYACGNPLMVDAARTDFTAQRGLPAGEFFADAFTPAMAAQATGAAAR
ncbi:MAG: CDP-6-deoxy-delta-3,4-glucoseen reductase [Burkholderiales bacterium]|nr:CDP-6-deoxy-delta-3,4-glucoseen reductase [Burkholderiales bacterium]